MDGRGAGAPCPGALRKGPGGATIWLNNCQKNGSGPYRFFSEGGQGNWPENCSFPFTDHSFSLSEKVYIPTEWAKK